MRRYIGHIYSKFKGNTSNDKGQSINFYLDSPVKEFLSTRSVVVSGWLMPSRGGKVKAIRIINASKTLTVPYGLPRDDVLKAFPDRESDGAKYSGFYKKFTYADGDLRLEADFGAGFQLLHKQSIHFSTEPLMPTLYNPDLAINWAEHLNLLAGRRMYFYEDGQSKSYSPHRDDPRLIAFYLPQFHPIKENDQNWGKGFTEWSNVAGAQPRFIGHQQPILPSDLGFYDLRLDEVIDQQIQLAKHHGIYGFCFYYYWFSGQKLLDRPLNSFIRHKEWDFNFLICWANENWTKRWDGREKDVIIAQKYRDQDPLEFIKDVEGILLDPRYIRHNGKPVLIVYRASELQQPKNYAKIWREYFRAEHKLELELVSVMNFDVTDPRSYGFNTGLDFAPQTTFFKKAIFKGKRFPDLDVRDKLIDINFSGAVSDYRKLALNQAQFDYFGFPTYKSVATSWDNDARRKGDGYVFCNSSPDLYSVWLDRLLHHETKRQKAPLVFINAWNEWAEGATLEPTMHLGHSLLKRTTETLAKYSPSASNKQDFPVFGIRRQPGADLAVIIYIYYEDGWGAIEKKLKLLEEVGLIYDLFISLSSNARYLSPAIEKFKKDAYVQVVPNRGRDVLPFLHAGNRLNHLDYKYLLKLHTKKSQHRDDGSEWFDGLLNNLLANPSQIKKTLEVLDKSAAMVGPGGHFVSLERYMGGNAGRLKGLLEEIFGHDTAVSVLEDSSAYGYFGGTMFWARFDTLKPIFDLHLLPDDFEAENGQIDGTLAHALERLFGLMPTLSKRMIYEVSPQELKAVSADQAIRDYKFAP